MFLSLTLENNISAIKSDPISANNCSLNICKLKTNGLTVGTKLCAVFLININKYMKINLCQYIGHDKNTD